jgi:ribulose-bisphosphate carboxylase large chain
MRYLLFGGGRVFIRKGYKPKNELVASFYAEPARGKKFEEVLEAIAKESSIGTWTSLRTMTANAKKLAPKIFYFSKKKHLAKIAYPEALFERASVVQILSSLGGNIYGMKDVKNLRWLDIELPASFCNAFKGPAFGIKGVRKYFGVKDRPLLGTIVKPKVGLSAKQHAKVAYEAWLGGCDIVKDDENLTDMRFNRFERRLRETLKMKRKAERITAEPKAYMANISAPAGEMLKRAKLVKRLGGNYIMIDIIACGFSAVQYIRNQELGMIIHAHRAGHAAFTRNPKHGISMLVVAKLARLAGVDQLHIGTVVGKMHGPKQEVLQIHKALHEPMGRLKGVVSVCSGGLHPGHVPDLLKIFGKDIVIQAGGGIHGHRQGTFKGAVAMRQAIEACLEGITLSEYAKKHKELAIALKQWC